MGYMIVRAQGTVGFRDQIINMVVERTEGSESYHTGILRRLPRLYDLFRGVYTGNFHPHKNNIHIPIILGTVYADAARKAATSLNAWPIVNFVGYGPDDMPIARKREALISAQMKDADAFEKEVNTYIVADLYGVAISQVMWDRVVEKRIVDDVASIPLSGQIVRTIKKQDVISFDGPNWEPVDRIDFMPQPGIRTIKKMKYVIRRYFLDVDDLRAMVAKGIFDGSEVARLIAEGGVGAQMATDQQLVRRFQARTGMTEQEAKFQDKYTRPVEILEYWGIIPSEFATDGVLNRVITVANRRYLLRNRPSPFWHGMKPFLSFAPMPDPHYFDAAGKAEISEKLQLTANRFVNQGLDGAELAIDPMWFYNRNKGLNVRGLYSRPGRFIGVDGDPSSVVTQMRTDLSGIREGVSKAEEMRRYAQMGTGILDDAVQGLEGPDRQTAREFVGRREAAGTRLMLESRLYEETYLEPLANMMVMLDKQFLDLPKEVLIMGDSSQVDPVTGSPIPGSRERLDGYDLVPNYAARAMGATSGLSRGVRQQNLGILLQYVSSAPQIAGAVNMVNFMRYIFREFEIPNINEVIQQQPGLQQVLAQATGGQGGAQQVPTSGQMALGMNVLPQQPGMPADNQTALAGTLTPQH
jgi:hypothetical protein